MKKKIGLGSLALLFSILCIFLSLTFNKSGICYGDKLINFLGLKSWSSGTSGTHYTLFYMIPFFALSIFLGYKFCDNFGAKIGRRLSIFFVSLIVISIPFMAVSITSYENNNNVEQNTIQADYLFNLKNKYIGNASANSKLLEELEISKLGNYTMELETSNRPYVLYINFTNPISITDLTDETYSVFKEKMKMYSIILLALIDNADEIHYKDRYCDCIDNIVKIKTNDLKEKYGDIKAYGKSVEDLHSLLSNIGYYSMDSVTLSIKNNSLTNTGVTLLLTNQTNHEYTYGESYDIERQENGKWVKVKTIIEDYGFDLIGYTLGANQTVEIKKNWEWLYGKLPIGQYRINTHIIYGTGGDLKTYPVSAEFIIN